MLLAQKLISVIFIPNLLAVEALRSGLRADTLILAANFTPPKSRNSTMPVHLSFTFTELTPPLLTQNKIVIMLDVFRASTTIITALSQGAHKIIPP